jgi:type 1 glutamine amidotransferase
MKTSRRFLLSVLGLCVLSQLKPAAFAEPGKLKLLFLGHNSKHHDSNVYSPILREALAPRHVEMDYATSVDVLNPENLKQYDAVLLYANHGRITPEQFAALSDFVESGHGFVPVHCASACFGHSPEFVKLVGGRFKSHKSGVFKATVVHPTHPVMQGFTEFETWDETYVHSDHNPEARTVLMERVEGEAHEPWTWVREQGKGRVFYTASGHDERTWRDASFLDLLYRGIVWSVGDARKQEWETARPK